MSKTEIIAHFRDLLTTRFHGDMKAMYANYAPLRYNDLLNALYDAGIGSFATRRAYASAILQALDTDHDGSISESELSDAIHAA